MSKIKGESGFAEKVSFACDVFILAILLWDQIRYGLNMLYLIIPLIIIGAYLFFFCVIPEEYIFSNESLVINHIIRKPVKIMYDSVFNYEASKRDGFINIWQSNRVTLYYQKANSKMAVVCRPCDVETFVELIKTNCKEFQETIIGHSQIEVFFDDN